jgi:hypothetical protein
VVDAETELEMVERHIRAGERHVANQQEIVAFLRSHNYPSEQAEELLDNLTDLLRLHREHLARISA